VRSTTFVIYVHATQGVSESKDATITVATLIL